MIVELPPHVRMCYLSDGFGAIFVEELLEQQGHTTTLENVRGKRLRRRLVYGTDIANSHNAESVSNGLAFFPSSISVKSEVRNESLFSERDGRSRGSTVRQTTRDYICRHQGDRR